jgi:hypothetical protein
MLYKLRSTGGKFDNLHLLVFYDFSRFGNLEKDLEEPVAKSIQEVLLIMSS